MPAHFLKLYQYGKDITTHDVAKILAITLMIIDHIGEYILNDAPAWRLIGRGAAPIFFFLIGYNNKLHVTRPFLVYGFILSFTGMYFTQHIWISILINFIVIDFILKYYPIEKMNTVTKGGVFLAASIATLFTYNYLEYGFLGLMIAYAGRLVAMQKRQKDIWLALSLVIYFIWQSLYFHFTKELIFLVFFGLMLLVGYFAFRCYHIKKFTAPTFISLPALCLSRYSLEIYFYHLTLLQIYFLLHLFVFT